MALLFGGMFEACLPPLSLMQVVNEKAWAPEHSSDEWNTYSGESQLTVSAKSIS